MVSVEHDPHRLAKVSRIAAAVAVLASSLLTRSTLAEEAKVELPKYKLEVGQELSYTGEDESTRNQALGLLSSKEKYSQKWRIVVLAANEDGSWRVALIHQMKYGDFERTSIAKTTLFPDGRLADDPSIGLHLDPAKLLVRLPGNQTELEQGWSVKIGDGSMRCSVNPQTDRASGKWLIDVVWNGPWDAVYELSTKGTATFDANRGLIVQIDAEGSQGYGIKSTSVGKMVLDSTKALDATQISEFERKVDAFLAATSAYDKLMRKAAKDAAAAEAFSADGKSIWDTARSEITDATLLAVIDKNLTSHASTAKYVVDEATRRNNVIGKPAADWELDDLAGTKHSLEGYRGKVVILDFWYRGCGWCIRAMPAINQVTEAYREKPVVVLGMNSDRDLDDAKFVAETMALKYLTLQATGIAEKYSVQGFPTLVIIDQLGNVHDFHVGYSPNLAEELTATIDTLLAKTPAVDSETVTATDATGEK